MSETKKESNERIKIKKKMKKIELQHVLIKKKQCDAKALVIVEQLLESNMNPDWLLENLKFINKTHMEDAIEERAIVKLCGYVLCSKPLTVVVKQQYRISTRTNKVYDISKRKKFCSSWCYAASNYLLEQMLESPLWLREKEVIPVFKFFPINCVQSLPGDEVHVGINFSQNTEDIDKNKEHIELVRTKQTKNHSSMSSADTENSSHLSNNYVKECTVIKKSPANIETRNLYETHSSELYTDQQDKECIPQEHTNEENENNDHTQEENIKLENLETNIAVQSNILHIHEHVAGENAASAEIICSNSNTEMLQSQLVEISDNTNDNKMSHSQLDEVNIQQLKKRKLLKNSHDTKDDKTVQFRLDSACSNQDTTISPKSSNGIRNKSKKVKNKSKNKHECIYNKQGESDNAEVQANVHHSLIMHVEQSFREWVTKNTFCLLLDEGDEKFQLLENLTQRDRYEQLRKKLNRLQLQDEKEDHVDLRKSVLKPIPHLSVLQEEGKKLELKVRAFYKGKVVIDEDNNSKSKNEDEGEEPVLPLTDAHAPNALRRRIFLDKLNKVLPDLLYALTRVPASASSVTQNICNNDTYLLIKLLISTFHLSATNIVFKTAEWTLVGLIIIKMLSLIDMQLQSMLRSKEASMYTSMILMSYKLDSSYLDRLVMDMINNKNIRKSCNKPDLLE